MKQKGHNIYIYMLHKLLLAMGVYVAMQLSFYLFNTRLFHISSWQESLSILWGNVIFGAATLGTFLAPFFLMMLLPLEARWKKWYRAIAETLYILGVLLMIIPRGANTAYYQYTYRLLSDEIFSYLGISGQMGSLAPHFATDYWYAWVIPLCIFIIFLLINRRIQLAPRHSFNQFLGNDLFGMVIGIVIVWFLARGGFGHFIQPTDAAHYAQPKNTALVNNDAYNIFRTLFTDDLQEVPAPDPIKFTPWYEPSSLTSDTHAVADSLACPRNIVLIILESIGQEFMGCYNTQPDADTRTPFLDSLSQYCTLYDGRSNGKKSIEGITAITTSIPNLMSIPFTNSPYSSDRFIGLPTILKRHGYQCGFFHGSYNGVMSFDSTCYRLGFDEYLGKDEYEASGQGNSDDYDGVWGIFDEPFLQYTVRHISTYQEPFLAEIFTTSSHHPYPIPKSHKGQFEEGNHPILKCVEYTDYALRRFFEQAKKQPWYNNTLFIICGDHSGHGLSPEYNDYDGWYRIPMMFFDPQHPKGQRSSRIVQQIDLFPTLIDYLGFSDSFVCFGQSILQQPSTGYYVYYGNGYHALISNNPQSPEHHDITLIMGDYEKGSPEQLGLLKSIIYQYNTRILNDQLLEK